MSRYMRYSRYWREVTAMYEFQNAVAEIDPPDVPQREALAPVPTPSAPDSATILRHCRCIDCRNFSQINGEYFC